MALTQGKQLSPWQVRVLRMCSVCVCVWCDYVALKQGQANAGQGMCVYLVCAVCVYNRCGVWVVRAVCVC